MRPGPPYVKFALQEGVMAATTYPVKNADRNYVIEMFLVAVLYVGVTWARPWLVAHAGSPELVMAAAVAPAIPIWLTMLVVWRYYRHIDEYRQKRLLEVLSLTWGIGVGVIVTIDAIYPKTTFEWAWPVLGVTWSVVTLLQSVVTVVQYKRSLRG
jgi:amino acid permease